MSVDVVCASFYSVADENSADIISPSVLLLLAMQALLLVSPGHTFSSSLGCTAIHARLLCPSPTKLRVALADADDNIAVVKPLFQLYCLRYRYCCEEKKDDARGANTNRYGQ